MTNENKICSKITAYFSTKNKMKFFFINDADTFHEKAELL